MQIDGRDYIPRILDDAVERHLRAFGAVEVAGTMWSGKTWTSRAHAKSMASLDDANTRELAGISPDAVLAGPAPRVLDEWQEAPSLWDAVRRNSSACSYADYYTRTFCERGHVE